MTQFLGGIAGMLEIFAIAAGFILLHLAAKAPPAKLLKVAAIILIVGGIGSGLCTGYYWFKYQRAGHFDRADSFQMGMDPESMPRGHVMPGGDAH